MSDVYLIVVMLILPGPNAPSTQLAHEWTTASTPAVCQTQADKAAARELAKSAPIVQRLGARVVGLCIKQGETS